MDSSNNVIQFVVDHDGVDSGSGKWIKKLTKVKKPQGLKNLQRLLVWTNQIS